MKRLSVEFHTHWDGVYRTLGHPLSQTLGQSCYRFNQSRLILGIAPYCALSLMEGPSISSLWLDLTSRSKIESASVASLRNSAQCLTGSTLTTSMLLQSLDVNAVSLTQQTLQWWTAALARVEAVSHLVGVLGQKAAGLTAGVRRGWSVSACRHRLTVLRAIPKIRATWRMGLCSSRTSCRTRRRHSLVIMVLEPPL